MQLLNLTLDTPAKNLALDEALLESVNQTASGSAKPHSGILRFWELPNPCVVVGRATIVDDEVNRQSCRQLGVPVLRRVSGGMSVVAGPGCLMYTIVAPHPSDGGSDINAVHTYVLTQMASSLRRTTTCAVSHEGTSDLAICDDDGALKKFSGNSLRMGRNAFLYHGTLLYDFDLALISKCLHQPPRSPDYRSGRPHADFVANLPSTRFRLEESIAEGWNARDNLKQWPTTRTEELVLQRYSLDTWNHSR